MRSDDTQTQSISYIFFTNNYEEKYHFFKQNKTRKQSFNETV